MSKISRRVDDAGHFRKLWSDKHYIGKFPLSWYWSGEGFAHFWAPKIFVVLAVLVLGGLGYVARHFITKYW